MRPAGNGRGSQPPPGATVITANLNDPKVEYEEELLLKWDDHHKSFSRLQKTSVIKNNLLMSHSLVGSITFLPTS
jgi:hypothetical protein